MGSTGTFPSSHLWTESQHVTPSASRDSMTALGEEFATSNHGSSGEDGFSFCQEDTPSLSMSDFSLSFSRSNSATVPLIAAACSPQPVSQTAQECENTAGVYLGGKVHERQKREGSGTWLWRTFSSWKQHFPSTFKTECKELSAMAWPIVVTHLSRFTLQLTSAVFCGHLGKVYLDAIALGNMVLNTCGIAVLIGLGCACDTLFAQTFGSVNKKSVGVVLQRSVLILLLSCLPCCAILINTENLLSVTGQDKQIARLAGQFAMASLPVLPAEALQLVLTKYLQAQSIVLPSMVIFLVIDLANFGLHAVLIFGVGLGVVGAAVSVSISYWLLCLLHVIFIRVSRLYQSTWDGWHFECLYNWMEFLRLAVPGLFMVCLPWWCFEIFTILAGLLSPEELAADSIVYQLGAIVFMVPVGLSVAVCIRVGNSLGAGNTTAAVNSAKTVITMAALWSVLVAALFLAIKDFCPYAFTNDRLVGDLSRRLIPVMCLLQIGDAIQCVGAGVVIGCGGQRLGATINLIGYYFIAMPLSSILMFKTSLRIVGAWWGLTLCTVCQAIAFSLVILSTDWVKCSAEAQIRSGVHLKNSPEEDSSETKDATTSSLEKDGVSSEGTLNSSLDQEYQGVRSTESPNSFQHNFGSERVQHVAVTQMTNQLPESRKRVILQRSGILVLYSLILVSGIIVKFTVNQSDSSVASCILVSGSEVNETWLSFQIHHRESFQKMSEEDQKILNLTFWYEMNHHWNKTFLYCGETIEEPDSSHVAENFNLTRLYSHLAMASRPSG